MNKKNIKTPFISRTVLVMVIIFLAAAGTATYITAQNYINEMMDQTDHQLEAIVTDINECKDANRDSVEYRDRLNVAQAYAVMRYYRFITLKDFRYYKATADAALYKIETDADGNETGFHEALPETSVIYAAPFSTRSNIIVLEDAYPPQQVKQIEDIIKNGDMSVYMENSEGYKEGRFFYPTRLPISDDVTIKSDQPSHSGKIMSYDMQDLLVVLSDGSVVGGHQNERLKPYSFRAECEDQMKNDVTDGEQIRGNYSMAHQENQLEEIVYEHTSSIPGTDYIVKLYVQIHPLMYAMNNLIDFYITLMLIVLLMATVLIKGHNSVIEKRFETEIKRRHMMDSMAHEMKTPLSAIKGYGEVLLEEKDESKREYYTRGIIDEANDMNQVIISMLDFSKMEAGTYPMELSDVSVGELAGRQLNHAQILLQQKYLQVEVDIRETPRILADAKLINSILSNFLSNGINHASAGGKLKLTVNSEGDEIYIAVYNQGPNVSENDMIKMWDSFYRNRKTNEDSSGLGLAIVRNASLMHNGSYGCYNEDDGVTFWAKVKSMEDNIQMAEATTGPVIGVTGEAYELNGIVLIAFGALLQLIYMCPQIVNAFSYIYYLNDFDLKMPEQWLWSDAGIWIMIIGANIAVSGSYELYQKSIWSKKLFIASVIPLLLAVATLIMTPDISGAGNAVALIFIVFIWFVLVIAMVLKLFSTCMKIERDINIPLKQLNLKRRRILFIAATALWFVTMGMIWIDTALGPVQLYAYFVTQIGRYGIPLALLVTFFRVWKQYNGKLKELVRTST